VCEIISPFGTFILSASAQFDYLGLDNMGRPIVAKQYVDVKGTPYLMDEWVTGSVKFNNGKLFEGVQLKYNQVEDELMFLDKAKNELLFVEPVLEFKIGERVFRRGYTSVDGASPMAFYEVLTDGKTQLLKRTTKKIHEELTYNSATKPKSFVESNTYYISKSENQLTKVKKDKKSVLNALNDKNAELESYFKTNRPDLKKDVEMAKLVEYYNSK
ncbi:hypothetical protein, partial [Pontibacter sp. HJ8]